MAPPASAPAQVLVVDDEPDLRTLYELTLLREGYDLDTAGTVEDALLHLLNYVWPNVYEKSPHVISAVFEAVEALRVSLGPGVIFAYLRAGLFHPARRVREVHWRLYNNLVAYSGHALPAWLPSVPEETEDAGGGGGRYERSVLLLCA